MCILYTYKGGYVKEKHCAFTGYPSWFSGRNPGARMHVCVSISPPKDRIWNRFYMPPLSGEIRVRRESLVPIQGNV